jgi:AraC-like DNA-binding protein
MLGTGEMRRQDLWHFIPFIIQVIHIVPYWLSSFESKFTLAQQVIEDPGTLFSIPWGWLYPSYFNFFGRPLFGLIYALSALFFLYRNTNLFTQRSIYQNDLFRWFILFLVGICSLYAINLSVLTELFTVDGSVKVILSESNSFKYQGFIYLFLGIIPLFFPHILYGNIENLTISRTQASDRKLLKIENDEAIHRAEDLPKDRLLAIDHQIKSYLTSQKPYLNPAFNLSIMSEVLDIPEYHLHYYFTYFKKHSFGDYLIDLRIEHAKNLLAWGDSSELRLEAIAKASGYHHINSFIDHFKKVTGMLPSEYMNLMNPLPET